MHKDKLTELDENSLSKQGFYVAYIKINTFFFLTSVGISEKSSNQEMSVPGMYLKAKLTSLNFVDWLLENNLKHVMCSQSLMQTRKY